MFNRVSLIVGIVALIIAGATGYLIGSAGGSGGGNSEQVIQSSQSFIKALAKGNVDEIHGYISETFQARNGKSHIEEIAKSVKSDNPAIADEEVFLGDDSTANEAIYLSTVNNLPEKNNSTKGNFIIRLVKESGNWKIDSAQIY